MVNEDVCKVFFLNVYNVGVKYVFVNVGVLRNVCEWLVFYGSVGYNIGGKFYFLDDIEYGLFRVNASYSIKKFVIKYFKDDGVVKYVFFKCDVRIYFVLNCGVNVCLFIRVYLVNKIDA